jgi:hypothetical protein
MHNPLALSLWLAMFLYAAATLFGIAVFHNVSPNVGSLTDGYGVAFSRVAVSDSGAVKPVRK